MYIGPGIQFGTGISVTSAPQGAPPTVDYIVVAGGGGGGHDFGGGGGAGGLLTATGQSISANSPVSVTIGSGGSGATTSVRAANGTNSLLTYSSGSVSFNGTSQYLSAPNSTVLQLGSNNFTIEAWVYPTGTNTDSSIFYINGNSTSYAAARVGWGYNAGAPTTYLLVSQNGSTWAINSGSISGGPASNTWTHMALVRNGTAFTLYRNGVSIYTTTLSGALYAGTLNFIGAYQNTSYYYFPGYFSNIRIVNGIAVYTGAFTPPTNPLTITQNSGTNIAAITSLTSTSLLLNTTYGTSFIVDSSTNNLTMTNNGAATSIANSPFNITSTGGGGGGGQGGVGNGGSGGGAQGNATNNTVGTGIAGQGFAGGPTSGATGSGTSPGGGGGGGATSVGTTAVGTSTPGNGGAGSVTTYFGSNLGSIYFNGSGQYLSLANNIALDFGGSNFTVECWIYPISFDATDGAFMGVGQQSGSASWVLRGSNAGSLNFVTWSGGGTVDVNISSATGLYSLNAWSHVAVTRNGTAIAVWLNGVTVATSVTSVAIGNTGRPAYIAYGYSSSAPCYQTCYISNVRWIKGLAVYTGTFTPPTNPLTVTQTAGTNISAISTSVTYSDSFDGTSQYLTAQAPSIQFGAGSFTIELWVYPTAAYGSLSRMFLNGPAGGTGYLTFFITSSGQVTYGPSGSGVLTTTGTVPLNAWTHIALSRISGITTIYINGVNSASGSDTTNFTNYSTTFIGSDGSARYYQGYISNLRIIVGAGIYTGNFTPPSSPLQITQTAGVNIAPLTNTIPTYSYSFNGSSQYLTTASNSAYEMGSSDYTVECWFYANANTDGGLVFKGQYQSGSIWLPGFGIRRNSATGLFFYFNTSTTNAGEIKYIYSGTTNINTWYHVAMVVKSGVGFAYLNGVLLNTGGTTGVGTIGTSATGMSIGIFPYSIGNIYFNGYVSNLRVVKNLAVYTGTFTPPTTQLTSSQFATTNIAAIPNIAPTYSYSFNGTNQYLTVPASSSFSFGTNDFTVEAWIYTTNPANTYGKAIIDARPDTTNGAYWLFSLSNTGQFSVTTLTTGGVSLTSPNPIPFSQWVHVAWTRKSGTLNIWVNGVSVASATGNTDNISSSILKIGANAFRATVTDTYFNGYMSNIRITKGIAVYTGNFTPSTIPLAIAQSANTNIAAIPSAGPYYSYSFNGSSQYLTVPTSTSTTLGTGDYTVEAWLYLTGSAANMTFYGGGVANTPVFNINALTSIALNPYGNGSLGSSQSYSFSLNTWYHVAFVRASTATKTFVNGIQIGSNVTDTTNYVQGAMGIGGLYSAGQYFPGYISNLRVVVGLAVYSSNFTPPTGLLTATQSANVNGNPSAAITGTQTALLTAQNNITVDNSTNAFTITNNGAVFASLNYPTVSATSLLTAQNSTIIDNSSYAFTITNNGSVTTTNTIQPFPVTSLLTAQNSAIVDNSSYAATVTNNGTVTTTNSTQPLPLTALLTAQSSTIVDNSYYAATITNTGTVTTTNTVAPLSFTSLLLNTVYGSSYLTDASTNNFSVTNNGAATSLPYNPFYSIAYAGGGGGGGYSGYGSPAGTGGLGGGGNGNATPNGSGTAGTVNTGSGGGGGGGGGSGTNITATGGSGIVVVRYSDTYSPATTTTGSPTYSALNGYRFYTFNSAGTLAWNISATTINYLLVAGGGGTNANWGAGGGGGGVLTGTTTVSTNITYTVTVGAGGTNNQSANGGNSSLGTILTAIGGGTGGVNTGVSGSNGSSGGSGGGGGGGTTGTAGTGGAGTAGQGNSGGAGYIVAGAAYAGGGGGAGAAGANATSSASGNGGSGVTSSITGTPVIYGGGGGGGSNTSGSIGLGGLGGGGSGSYVNTVAGTSGTVNTGGGAGGGSTAGGGGGIGGSGIVVISYPTNYAAAITTGNPIYYITGGYNIYVFNSSGTIAFSNTIASTTSVSYFLVAGGGGGGPNWGGGGGAGGLLTGTTAVTPGTGYTVTVGSGGANTPANGTNSSLGALAIAVGGGYSGVNTGASGSNGNSGGSGGGGGGGTSGTAGTGGSPTAGQGFAGGNGNINAGTAFAGGGGGASAAGANATSSASGNGGAGVTSSVTGTSVSYAGGGGGGAYYSGAQGSGGLGGGGAGGTYSPGAAGTSGTANTGGGGGGGGGNSGSGGTGGSGIVVISYPSNYAAATTTGNPTIVNVGGNITYVFTSSGSIAF